MNEFIKKDDVILIDTRNKYETSIGSFINSVDPKTDSFRDFPNFVKNNLDLPKIKDSNVLYWWNQMRKINCIFKIKRFQICLSFKRW